ncbi:MAG: hypothetical protein M3446_09050 [Actinomycetota bacterium]|nr:hypothetical protein [Actinomycetota bacterium]
MAGCWCLTAGESTLRDYWLRAVSLDHEVERLPYGPASALAWGPGGALVLCSAWAREPAYWKRATPPQLWLDPDGGGEWRRLLPGQTAGLAWPMWVNGRIVFVGDQDGVGNLYSVDSTGADLQQHTDHEDADGFARTPAPMGSASSITPWGT